MSESFYDDLNALLREIDVDPEDVYAEAQMCHIDWCSDADLNSFCAGFALASYLYGAGGDGGRPLTLSLPEMTA